MMTSAAQVARPLAVEMADGSPAFAEVFRRHLPYVWRVLRSLGVPPAEVEDLCQDVFIVVHRRLPDFEGRSSLSSWIYGICWRVWQDQRRRPYRQRERAASEVPEVVAEATQGDAAAHHQTLERLGAILDRLDAGKRTVFVLYEIEQLTMKEVAQVVSCPLQTAYTRLHAARDYVRAQWQRLYGETTHG
jgi:RNA polymerase sigma-70 factor (ECF subfamily)